VAVRPAAAIIVRAYHLDKITEPQYRYFNAELSRLGSRKREPALIPPEEPQMFREILEVHRSEHGRDVATLSRMLGLHEHQFREMYGPSTLCLRIEG
jgi:hypothetical protein